MDNNDKSTALVSVSDLSVVLQGVKRYIDSSKPNVSWDNLANGETIHCDDWHPSIILPSQVELSGVKIPAKAIVGNVVSFRNITAENGIAIGDESISKEELQEALPESIDITLEGSENLAQGLFGNGYALGAITIGGSAGVILFGEKGSDHMFLAWSPVIAPTSQTPLLSCDLVQDTSLCPQDYVESSLGNANLKEDIKALSEKKPTWDDLYGGGLKRFDTFEEFAMSFSGMNVTCAGIKLKDSAQEGDVFNLKNVTLDGDLVVVEGGVQYTRTKEFFGLPMDVTITLQPADDGTLMGSVDLQREDGKWDSIGIAVFDGKAYLFINSVFETQVYGSIYPQTYNVISCPLSCELESEASPCPPSYVASSIGNESLEEDIKFLKENSGCDLPNAEELAKITSKANDIDNAASNFPKIVESSIDVVALGNNIPGVPDGNIAGVYNVDFSKVEVVRINGVDYPVKIEEEDGILYFGNITYISDPQEGLPFFSSNSDMLKNMMGITAGGWLFVAYGNGIVPGAVQEPITSCEIISRQIVNKISLSKIDISAKEREERISLSNTQNAEVVRGVVFNNQEPKYVTYKGVRYNKITRNVNMVGGYVDMPIFSFIAEDENGSGTEVCIAPTLHEIALYYGNLSLEDIIDDIRFVYEENTSDISASMVDKDAILCDMLNVQYNYVNDNIVTKDSCGVYVTKQPTTIDSNRINSVSASRGGFEVLAFNPSKPFVLSNATGALCVNIPSLVKTMHTTSDGGNKRNKYFSNMTQSTRIKELAKIDSMDDFFVGGSNLVNVEIEGALPIMDMSRTGLASCTKLSVQSLLNLLDVLPTIPSSMSLAFTVGTANLAKLSDEQKSIATNKGWTLN